MGETRKPSKIELLLILDRELLTTPNLGVPERLQFVTTKYYTIAANKRRITYLHKIFRYDGRFAPIALQMYPKVMHFLDKSIGINRINTVLDIGANIGQFSFTLKALRPNAAVYCFEPNNKVFQILRENMASFGKIRLFNYGIGNPGKRAFYSSSSSSGLSSFYRHNLHKFGHKGDIKKSTVECVRLGKKELSEMKIPRSFDLVKIDVEGAEMEVLRSLSGIKCKYILIECGRGPEIERIKKEITNRFRKNPILIGTKELYSDSPSLDCLFKLE